MNGRDHSLNLRFSDLMEILIKDKKHLPAAAKQLLKHCGERRILPFTEQWVPAKQLLSKLSVKSWAIDIVSSPTFTLVNEYRTSGGESIYHIDFYRIKKQEEVFDFGIEEYLTGDSYCFMEWPELIEEILPPETVKVRISVDENEQRILSIS